MSVSQSGAQAAALSAIQAQFPIPSDLLPAEVATLQANQLKLAASIASQATYTVLNAVVMPGISVSTPSGPGATDSNGTLS